jgi:hypothetical protein
MVMVDINNAVNVCARDAETGQYLTGTEFTFEGGGDAVAMSEEDSDNALMAALADGSYCVSRPPAKYISATILRGGTYAGADREAVLKHAHEASLAVQAMSVDPTKAAMEKAAKNVFAAITFARSKNLKL